MAEALRLEGLRAGYGESVVVEDVSLSVGAGECVALLGRNGVGKSTLLLTLMGYTRQHRGSVTWEGRDGWRALSRSTRCSRSSRPSRR